MVEENEKAEQTPQEATTVGMFLKYTRQNQKKSIEAVSKILCIRKIYIKAIEESDFNELPPIPYGVGFVRSYAELLGLNAERIVQCYKEEAMPKKNDNNSKPIIKKHSAITMPNRKQITVSVLLVLALYFAAMYIGYNKEISLDEPQEEIQQVVEEEKVVAKEEATEEKSPVSQIEAPQLQDANEDVINVVEESYLEEVKALEENAVTEEAQEQPKEEVVTETTKNKVVVKLIGETWLEIKDSKKVYVSGIYKKGFEYEIPNAEGIIFSVGRYFNVEVYIDGVLTKVARPTKQTNIKLDDFLNH